MGLLDDIKDNLGFGDKQDKAEQAQQEAKDAAAEAKKKADEAKQAQAEADKESGKTATPGTPKAEPAVQKTEPTAQKAEQSKAADRTYTVKKGDTLSEIGQRYGVSWHKIAEVNNIDNPDLIYPGQVFTIPS